MPLRISVEAKDAAVVADLREAAQAADRGGGGERLQVAVIDLGRKAGRADLVKTDVLGELKREPIGADGAMEGDEHLALLGVADALHVANQPRALRQEKLLMIVGVVVGGQHDHDRPAETAVDMVGDDAFQHRSLEDPVETALDRCRSRRAPSDWLLRIGFGCCRRCDSASAVGAAVAGCRRRASSCSASTAVGAGGGAVALGCAKSIATVSLLMASCCCFSAQAAFCLASA